MEKIKHMIPELVSPAGDWPSLHSAIDAGADAVYFGIKELNMRLNADNFDRLEMVKVVSLLHKSGRKGYLALNIIAYEKEIPKIKKILMLAKDAGVDALIAWDMGIIQLASELKIPVHLSTQASVSNFLAVKFYFNLGVKRIVLARECALSDIEEIAFKIKKQGIDCSVEIFIHGAMCVSIAGRCLFSQHLFNKSANRGECFQPCRREFLIKDKAKGNEYVLGEDYVLGAKDLCTIEFLERLIESGASALKIEGRMRSPEYVQVVTLAYRKAIDAYFKGKLNLTLKKSLRKKLETVFNRGFETGFYLGRPYRVGSPLELRGRERLFIGEITNFYNRIGVAEVLLRNSGVSLGDELLIYGKTTAAFFSKVSELQINHQAVKDASKGNLVGIKLESAAKPNDKVFLWKERN